MRRYYPYYLIRTFYSWVWIFLTKGGVLFALLRSFVSPSTHASAESLAEESLLMKNAFKHVSALSWFWLTFSQFAPRKKRVTCAFLWLWGVSVLVKLIQSDCSRTGSSSVAARWGDNSNNNYYTTRRRGEIRGLRETLQQTASSRGRVTLKHIHIYIYLFISFFLTVCLISGPHSDLQIPKSQ